MLPWLVIAALLFIVIALWVKIRLLERAFDEISEGLAERLEEDTNTLLSLSTRDPHARHLASELNRQLRQLRAQRQRYQNGDRELKEEVTNISHDLRTPLTAIRGYLDLMSRENLPPETRRYLELISDRAEAMTRLSEELFRYSVIQSSQPLSPEITDLRAAVEGAVAGLYAALRARGIEPVITLPESPVTRSVDRAALSRVLGNILGNALKYSAGDLEIVLTEDGELSFTNIAPGLDEVAVGRLFDRFFTVEAARGSTGLGLAIARTLTEQMGATVTASYASPYLTILLKFPQ